MFEGISEEFTDWVSNTYACVKDGSFKSAALQKTHYLGVRLLEPSWWLSAVLCEHYFTSVPANSSLMAKVFFVAQKVLLCTFTALAALATIPLFLIGSSLRAVTSFLNKEAFVSIETKSKNTPSLSPKIMTFNACMMPGCLPRVIDNLSPATKRFDALVKMIQETRADVVCLQEISENIAYKLAKEFEDSFSHFYLDIGPNPFAMGNGLFVACKACVLQASFQDFSVKGMQQGYRRGFLALEFADYHLITTHLEPHNEKENQAIRKVELQAIIDYLESLPSDKPIFLAGDLNIQRDETLTTEDFKLLQKHFSNPLKSEVTCVNKPWNKEMATATENELKTQGTTIDYLLMYKNSASANLKDPEVINTLPFSDHKALSSKIVKNI